MASCRILIISIALTVYGTLCFILKQLCIADEPWSHRVWLVSIVRLRMAIFIHKAVYFLYDEGSSDETCLLLYPSSVIKKGLILAYQSSRREPTALVCEEQGVLQKLFKLSIAKASVQSPSHSFDRVAVCINLCICFCSKVGLFDLISLWVIAIIVYLPR